MSDVIPFSPRMARVLPSEMPSWPPWLRVLFRFAFTYLALSAWFWLFEFADKSTALLAKSYHAFWRPFAQLIAHHVFHWAGAIEPNFVRDTRYLYALLTCFLAVSILTTIVWSILDRKRKQYDTLNYWMRVFLRYLMAYLMLHYGMDKVFLLQFPAPSLARLTERFGDYSPSSLMWTFIGSSALFTVFGGVAEIVGAALLLTRRTTTLGALITFAVMFNVTVMDLSYDVSVKIFCLNILLMASYLILPDAGRLFNFFFLNRATQPAALRPVNAGYDVHKMAGPIKILVVLFLIVPLTIRDWKSYHTIGAGIPHPPLYGLYAVDEFMLAGVAHPALLSDSTRWRYVIFEEANTLTLKHMDESLATYRIQYDDEQRTIHMSAAGDSLDKSSLTVFDKDAYGMTLQGSLGGSPIVAKLRRIDPSSFTLVNRGFHWINESSFVR